MHQQFDYTAIATQRLPAVNQDSEVAYSSPPNFLEIEVYRPMTHFDGKNRFTDYEVHLRTNLPCFRLKESSVRRRYSEFEWLQKELQSLLKIKIPSLPTKGWKLQLPFQSGDGIFDEDFIKERRKGLQEFIEL